MFNIFKRKQKEIEPKLVIRLTDEFIFHPPEYYNAGYGFKSARLNQELENWLENNQINYSIIPTQYWENKNGCLKIIGDKSILLFKLKYL